MKQRFAVLVATLLVAGWTMGVEALASEPAAPAHSADVGKWRAGTHYRLVPAPQPTSTAPGKVEVLEFFSYGCGRCFALDPTLESWAVNKPEYIEFRRVPVIWGMSHRQLARLHYTLQALRRPELHPKAFDAIHREGQQLMAESEADARALHAAFFKSQGVSDKEFDTAYDSKDVEENMRRAEELTLLYSVANVPEIIVNGKYVTSVGESRLLSLINDLAASEQQR